MHISPALKDGVEFKLAEPKRTKKTFQILPLFGHLPGPHVLDAKNEMRLSTDRYAPAGRPSSWPGRLVFARVEETGRAGGPPRRGTSLCCLCAGCSCTRAASRGEWSALPRSPPRQTPRYQLRPRQLAIHQGWWKCLSSRTTLVPDHRWHTCILRGPSVDSNPCSNGGHLRLGISSMWQILLGEELH